LQGHLKYKRATWFMDETYGALSSAQFMRVKVPPVLE
jgi:hypothetical protein